MHRCPPLRCPPLCRIKERFPHNKLLRAFDVFDRRRHEVAPTYGNDDVKLLASHYAPTLCISPADVVAEWDVFKTQLAARPATETWQQTYRHFKREWAKTHAGGALETLMDIKAVIVFASVCCETGFSKMKEAKKERQASMSSTTLDIRLRVQMLSPNNPRNIKHADDVQFKKAMQQYNAAISELLNNAIELYDPAKHTSAKAVRAAMKGERKRGSVHKVKKKEKRTDVDLGEFLLGNDGRAVIKRKAAALPRQGAAAALTEIPPPPPPPEYTPLEDALTIAPCVDLKRLDPDTLVGQTLVLLFKVLLENDVFCDWEWQAAPIVKATRRKRDKHVLVDVKFPSDNGKIRYVCVVLCCVVIVVHDNARF